ncbi:DUF1642 domain-containing protein [Levilactobacillus brevis]|uniref:DUF1642 domain-containing protein n=1 Tax=Levilactobacillus brevis TaxID=1580 RepID=UPI0021A32815|nr:DUF1642 domain-containing protein [Levilactobacillus brevis]MCT3574148.1 DUF1642 domain-containing protein [Levilactobacillus brevis]
MIKIYRKKVTIKAEQFDASEEMIEKYKLIRPIPRDPNYMLTTSEGIMSFNIGDWIVTRVNGEHWPIADDVFKKTYTELPVIPTVIAEYISAVKNGETDLEDINAVEAASGAIEYDQASHIEAEWIQQHGDEFARAWLDGYQVEVPE